MFVIIGIILLGVVVGLLSRAKVKPNHVSKVMGVIIYILLLVLGIVVGSNETIINNLTTIGLKALIISIGSILGSCVFAAFIYRKLFKK